MSLTYQEFLETDEWLETARRIRIRDHFTCQECRKRGWHVHHLTYDYGRLPPDEYLITLCDECHEGRHTVSLAELAKMVREWNVPGYLNPTPKRKAKPKPEYQPKPTNELPFYWESCVQRYLSKLPKWEE